MIDSLSKIYYNKDQMFIKERIKKIQQIFQVEDNAEYLRMLIEKKLEQLEHQEKREDNWIMSTIKNDFLMKSNITFHGAALEYIRSVLVKQLAFIIFYLEQDGVINASNEGFELFRNTKTFFKSRYD